MKFSLNLDLCSFQVQYDRGAEPAFWKVIPLPHVVALARSLARSLLAVRPTSLCLTSTVGAAESCFPVGRREDAAHRSWHRRCPFPQPVNSWKTWWRICYSSLQAMKSSNWSLFVSFSDTVGNSRVIAKQQRATERPRFIVLVLGRLL